jgi:hypothetical protein
MQLPFVVILINWECIFYNGWSKVIAIEWGDRVESDKQERYE